MSEKLKPCPCCGGKAELRKYTGGASLAICAECGLQTPFLPALDAEYRWNRRVKSELIGSEGQTMAEQLYIKYEDTTVTSASSSKATSSLTKKPRREKHERWKEEGK